MTNSEILAELAQLDLKRRQSNAEFIRRSQELQAQLTPEPVVDPLESALLLPSLLANAHQESGTLVGAVSPESVPDPLESALLLPSLVSNAPQESGTLVGAVSPESVADPLESALIGAPSPEPSDGSRLVAKA